MKDMQVSSLGGEDPLEEEMATNPFQYSCLGNPMDRGVLQGTGLQVLDCREPDATEHTRTLCVSTRT